MLEYIKTTSDAHLPHVELSIYFSRATTSHLQSQSVSNYGPHNTTSHCLIFMMLDCGAPHRDLTAQNLSSVFSLARLQLQYHEVLNPFEGALIICPSYLIEYGITILTNPDIY